MLIVLLSVAAGYDHSWTATGLLFSIAVILGGRMLYESALAMHKLTNVLEDFRTKLGTKTGDASEAKPVALQAIPRNS
jgi:hypothetical protein